MIEFIVIAILVGSGAVALFLALRAIIQEGAKDDAKISLDGCDTSMMEEIKGDTEDDSC